MVVEVVVVVVVVMVVVVVIIFIRSIYNYIPEANNVSRVCNDASIPFSRITTTINNNNNNNNNNQCHPLPDVICSYYLFSIPVAAKF